MISRFVVMTIEEARNTYGVLTYTTSEGDSLVWICRRLYGSDATVYRRIMEVLNPRLDWPQLPQGVELSYLSPDVVSQTALY